MLIDNARQELNKILELLGNIQFIEIHEEIEKYDIIEAK